jgi:hypothetical protein
LVALEGDQDLGAAWRLNEQSLALFQQTGHRRMAAVVLWTMGRVEWKRGDLKEAAERLRESVRTFGDVGDPGMLPQALSTLAAVHAAGGHTERAVQLQGAATSMERTAGIQVWPISRSERDIWLESARHALGDADADRAWAEGQAMTTEQAVAFALEQRSP